MRADDVFSLDNGVLPQVADMLSAIRSVARY
jgi:hypothetical protein